jgi:hypothetical protein
MMECQSNTEIAVHDAGNRITSLMYFQGDNTNTITKEEVWDGEQQILVLKVHHL